MSASASRSRASSSSQAKNRGKKESVLVQDASPDEPETPQLAWRVLTEQHVSSLESLSVRELAKELAGILKLRFEEDLRDAAILDYYVAGFWFAKENTFSTEQLSAFFTLLQIMAQNIKKGFSRDNGIEDMKHHLAGVGISQQTSLQCFTVETATLAIQYFSCSIFKHYQLFKYLFSEKQEEDHVPISLQVGLPPDSTSLCPAPLVEGITEEFHTRCMAPPSHPSPPTCSADEGLISRKDTAEGLNLPGHTTAPGDHEDAAAGSVLDKFSSDQVRKMIECMSVGTLKGYQEQIFQKLKSREEQFTAKLTKMEKKLA